MCSTSLPPHLSAPSVAHFQHFASSSFNMTRGLRPSLDPAVQAVLNQNRDEFRKLVVDGESNTVQKEFIDQKKAEIVDAFGELTKDDTKVCLHH